MANLRTESGKHIVTYNGKEYKFNTLRVALVLINLIEKRKNHLKTNNKIERIYKQI